MIKRHESFDIFTNELRCISFTSQHVIWIKSRWMTLRHINDNIKYQNEMAIKYLHVFYKPNFHAQILFFCKMSGEVFFDIPLHLIHVYVPWFVSISFFWLNLILSYQYWSFVYYWTDLSLWFIETTERIRIFAGWRQEKS